MGLSGCTSNSIIMWVSYGHRFKGLELREPENRIPRMGIEATKHGHSQGFDREENRFFMVIETTKIWGFMGVKPTHRGFHQRISPIDIGDFNGMVWYNELMS